MSSDEAPHYIQETSVSTLTSECRVSRQGNIQASEVRHSVDHDSDESDSEIFRVKRRSSAKMENRNVNEAISLNFEHQV